MPFRKVVIMYHSVSGPAAPAVLGSFPVALERLQHQIREAHRHGWRFGRVSQLREPVESNTLYITGDDGTVDWAENVLPWCEAEGIPTHTAIITGPWREPPIYPITHRVQILLEQPARKLPTPPLTPEQRMRIDQAYAYETDPRRRYLKGACNLVLDESAAAELLGPPQPDEAALLRRRFAAPQAYRGLTMAEFGVHTVRHIAFGGAAEAYVGGEVIPCRDDLLAAGLQPTACFTLPMRPRHPATARQLIRALTGAGFDGMFDGPGEWDGSSFIVPRIDAKNVETFLGLPAWQPDPEPETCPA